MQAPAQPAISSTPLMSSMLTVKSITDLNQSFLVAACAPRPDWEQQKRETREAIATYFQGNALMYLLPQYPKEEQEKFLWRRDAALENFNNYTKEISTALIQGVFRTKSPVRTTGDALLDEYLATDYQEWFRKEFAPFALILPEYFVKLDTPPAEADILSASDEQQLKPLPYPSTLFPYHAVNYGLDLSGSLDWVVFALDGTSPSSPAGMMQGPDTVPVTTKPTMYEIYTKEFYVAFSPDGEYINNPYMPDSKPFPIAHNMGGMPVVRVAYNTNLAAYDIDKAGHAMLHNTVKMTMGGLKAKSALWEYIYYSLRPKLLTTADQADSLIETGMGANKTIIVNPQGGSEGDVFRPDYLRVPVEEIVTLERICYERIPNDIYREAGLRDRSVLKKGAESGVAKAYDMIPETAKLKEVSNFLRLQDLAIVKKMAMIRGLDPSKVVVEYPTTFDTKSIAEVMTEMADFASAMQANGLPLPPQAKAIMAQRAIRAALPDLTEQDYEQMEDYINEQLKVNDGPESALENFREIPSEQVTNEAEPSGTVVPSSMPVPAASTSTANAGAPVTAS